jgi:hypothetical protein
VAGRDLLDPRERRAGRDRRPERENLIEAQGIRGRGFNNFEFGGYQAWRFWPDRSRLPFIDVHQAGTTLDRRLYVSAFGSAEGWRALDDRQRVADALAAAVAQGRPFEAEYDIERPSGETRHVYARAEPTVGANGAVTGLRGIVRDISR